MHPDAERFIDLATRPLDDNAELKLSAGAELRKAIEAENRPEALAEAADSLARADGHPRRKWWRISLLVVALLVSLPLLTHTVWQLKQLLIGSAFFSIQAISRPPLTSFPHLTPQQNLLLFGAGDASNESDKWKPLWDSEPENPAYLAEYALAYFSDHETLSPEILAAAERVDPENGWFLTLHATGIAKGAVTRERRPYSRTPNPATPVYRIDDEKRLQDTLSAIHQMTAKPRFTGWREELLRQRIPLFPARRDWVSQIPRMGFAFSQSSGSIQKRKLFEILAAGAQQCATRGDVEGFRQITRDWRFLAEASVKESGTMIDALVAKVIIAGPMKNFRDAARTLGLEEEAARFADLDDRMQQEKDVREKLNKSGSESAERVMLHGSLMAAMTIPMLARQVKSPPVLTEEDLRPSRYADHALFERAFSCVAWVLLGICAGLAALSRFRRSPLAWRLSERMQFLMRPSDWVWIVLGGVVFPLIWYFAITRLTPLAAREWSARMSMFIQPGGQFGGLVVSMIILPVVIASWRLAKRGAAIGMAARLPWLGWLAALAALAAVPAFGGMLYRQEIGLIFRVTAYALSGIAGIWLLAGIGLNFFGHGPQALRRATLSRLVWSVWVGGMLVLAALVPYFHAEERRWLQQDRIFEITAEFPASNRYEYQVTQVLRGELMETLDSWDKVR